MDINTSIDWARHMSAYETSGLTVAQYCLSNNLSVKVFKSQRYKVSRYTYNKKRAVKPKSPIFQEILSKKTEYKISIDSSGCASLSGIPTACLPAVMKVIFAVSK